MSPEASLLAVAVCSPTLFNMQPTVGACQTPSKNAGIQTQQSQYDSKVLVVVAVWLCVSWRAGHGRYSAAHQHRSFFSLPVCLPRSLQQCQRPSLVALLRRGRLATPVQTRGQQQQRAHLVGMRPIPANARESLWLATTRGRTLRSRSRLKRSRNSSRRSFTTTRRPCISLALRSLRFRMMVGVCVGCLYLSIPSPNAGRRPFNPSINAGETIAEFVAERCAWIRVLLLINPRCAFCGKYIAAENVPYNSLRQLS